MSSAPTSAKRDEDGPLDVGGGGLLEERMSPVPVDGISSDPHTEPPPPSDLESRREVRRRPKYEDPPSQAVYEHRLALGLPTGGRDPYLDPRDER